jgi:hypothetical protein
MKFEVNTQNDDLLKSSFFVVISMAILSFIVVRADISIKLGSISRHYEINYLCNLLTIEKSSLNFKKLSNLTKQNTKQKMWDLCREIVN